MALEVAFTVMVALDVESYCDDESWSWRLM